MRNRNSNQLINQVLAFSLIVFAVALFGILSRRLVVKEEKEKQDKSPQTIQSLPQNNIPVKVILKRSSQSNVNISIKNTFGKNINVRAFTLEVVVNKPLPALTENSIEQGRELEKAGFIFPIRKLEIKDKETSFKLAGVLIGNKMEIENDQEVNLASINLESYLGEEIKLSEETRIIDNSGNPLDFVIEEN